MPGLSIEQCLSIPGARVEEGDGGLMCAMPSTRGATEYYAIPSGLPLGRVESKAPLIIGALIAAWFFLKSRRT